MLDSGKEEAVFDGLKDPFYAVDSRDHQVIQPNHDLLNEMGAKILCIEKSRPHVPYERAVMGIRFSDYMIGTQFHPEADAPGMSLYLQTEEKRKTVIESHGEDKLISMLEHLNDPDKIAARTKEYEDRFLSPFIAAERGYIDDVIMPHSTRKRIARALAMLRDKKVETPAKKHDNLPL